jgi:hypothetical protein
MLMIFEWNIKILEEFIQIWIAVHTVLFVSAHPKDEKLTNPQGAKSIIPQGV